MTVPAKPRGVSVAKDPEGRGDAEDRWKDFRQIEKIDLGWEFTYRHSLGKTSRFFIELENKRLFASHCARCGQVWMPPRAVCPEDLGITTWKELSGKGVLYAFSISYARMASFLFDLPYVLAYVALEGATTLCLHQLRNYGSLERITVGMPVKVAYGEGPVAHPLWLMWFEPERG